MSEKRQQYAIGVITGAFIMAISTDYPSAFFGVLVGLVVVMALVSLIDRYNSTSTESEE